MFTGFVAIFYLSNCQRWDYISKFYKKQSWCVRKGLPFCIFNDKISKKENKNNVDKYCTHITGWHVYGLAM